MHEWHAERWVAAWRRGRKRYEMRPYNAAVRPGDLVRWTDGGFYGRITTMARFADVLDATSMYNVYPELCQHDSLEEYLRLWPQAYDIMVVRVDRCARPNNLAK